MCVCLLKQWDSLLANMTESKNVVNESQQSKLSVLRLFSFQCDDCLVSVVVIVHLIKVLSLALTVPVGP